MIRSITLAAIFTILFTSCKKDYTCTCTGTVTENSGPSSTVYNISKTTTIKKVKRSQAESVCTNTVASYADQGGSQSQNMTCVLTK